MLALRAAAERSRSPDPETIRATLESFLANCQDPVLVEPGEAPLPMRPGSFSLTVKPQGCVLEVWSDEGALVRRLTRAEEFTGRLALWASRFGGAEVRLEVFDRSAKSPAVVLRAERNVFVRTLRRMLDQRFPQWNVSQLTSAADLEKSLSPRFARGRMTLGSGLWAVIGAGEDLNASATDGILSYGLIWLDRVRRLEKRRACAGLRIIIPKGRESTTAARLRWLRAGGVQFELWAYSRRGELYQVQPETAGNLESVLPTCIPPAAPEGETAERYAQLLGRVDVESVPLPDGSLSLRVRGIEFAQCGRGVMTFGLDGRQSATTSNFNEALRLVDQLSRFRNPEASDPTNPLYARNPELWLESQVRKNPRAVEPSLVTQPIYSHVPASAGRDRGVIDLLAHDECGRLAVIELKADEDLHAPMQALDYWIRVRLAHERGDFTRRGYFPGIPLADRSPRLILAAPALKFHPTTETILAFLHREVQPMRVGLNAEWRRELRATFRLGGAERADSRSR